jgi:hypothetical protein
MARYQINDQMPLQANAENLTDETYYSQIGFYQQYRYGAPRKNHSQMAGWRFPISRCPIPIWPLSSPDVHLPSTRKDFSGLDRLASAAGRQFVQGIVLYDGERSLPFADNLRAVPFASVWA